MPTLSQGWIQKYQDKFFFCLDTNVQMTFLKSGLLIYYKTHERSP